MKEPNSSGDPELLKDPEFINDNLSTTDTGQHQSESQAKSDGPELADLLAANPMGATSADPAPDLARDGIAEQFRLKQLLEQACLATGATGAAIALVWGEQMVCRATTGPHAPDIGICLDPRTGLSGSCIQTRQLQQCNDTQTDPRVDPEACRRLGVRSIVVLPLMDGDELFGIVEILSSRPNAFSQRDLNTLQALTDRIVESRRQDEKATATVPRKEPGSFMHKLEKVVPEDESYSSESDSGFISRINDVWTTVLGVLVIGAAIMLGTLVGWRLGWQRATLGVRASSPSHRANVLSKTGQTDHTVSPAQELPSSSASAEECGPDAAGGPPAQPPSGGLTVCQDGRVIFRMAPSPPAARRSQTSQRSPGLKADPTRR